MVSPRTHAQPPWTLESGPLGCAGRWCSVAHEFAFDGGQLVGAALDLGSGDELRADSNHQAPAKPRTTTTAIGAIVEGLGGDRADLREHEEDGHAGDRAHGDDRDGLAPAAEVPGPAGEVVALAQPQIGMT